MTAKEQLIIDISNVLDNATSGQPSREIAEQILSHIDNNYMTMLALETWPAECLEVFPCVG